MQIISSKLNINFMAQRKLAMILSILAMVASVGLISTQGLKFGLDFTGGTVIELGYQQAPELETLRRDLGEAGYEGITVQNYGSSVDILVRLAPIDGKSNSDISQDVIKVLQSTSEQDIEMRRVEFVGPQVGKELAEDGGLAMLIALMAILLYVSMRFEKRFSLGAVAALIHDVTLIVGMFSLLQIEFDLTVLAALLAVIGYSLNDTIVVFDRIRENFRKIRKKGPSEVINASINETLSRTLVTSLTTLLVLLALFFFGGASIHSFAESLIMGIVVGTYSSIYIASSMALMLGVTREDLMPEEKDQEELDSMP